MMASAPTGQGTGLIAHHEQHVAQIEPGFGIRIVGGQ
jgi:hypothetical protein